MAKYYSIVFDREINATNEILITVGDYGSLFNAFNSLLDSGDEVIIIEPFFDCYAPMSILPGAKCIYIPLRPDAQTKNEAIMTSSSSEWKWNVKELEAAFSSKTKLIVISNTITYSDRNNILMRKNSLLLICRRKSQNPFWKRLWI